MARDDPNTPRARFPIQHGQTGRSDREHEDKCTRCGTSCHLAVPIGERAVVVPGLHCKFLSAQTDGRFSCTVYGERFERAPWCHHADTAAPAGFLSLDCAYARERGMTKGKERLAEDELALLWPELLQRVRSWGVPNHVGRAALLLEVAAREGGAYELVPWPGDSSRWMLRPVEC